MKRFKIPHPTFLLSLVLTAALHGQAFYGDPPDENHPWAVHDMNRPQPPLVTPGTPSTQDKPGTPPSDAIILFDGSKASLKNWESDKSPAEASQWIVKDGALQCTPGSGYIRTKELFADCQLHIEWAAPEKVEGSSQGRGNSGVFLMGKVEVQVLDNYQNPTYADGFASSIYGVNPPMANALRAPGEWQTYDIIFRRPVHDANGTELDPGRLTVLVNGIVTQDSTALEGGGGYKSRSASSAWPETGPLKLQDHGNPVRYRNIWYRPLTKRSVENGTDGRLSPEATTAKRQQIASQIREDAAAKSGFEATLRLMESLYYAVDVGTLATTQKTAAEFYAAISALSGAKLNAKKDQIKGLHNAMNYLSRHQVIASPYPEEAELKKIIDEKGWDK